MKYMVYKIKNDPINFIPHKSLNSSGENFIFIGPFFFPESKYE